MAVYYFDSNSGLDTNDGLTWATAKKDIFASIGIFVAGDVVYLRNGAGGGYTVTLAATATYTFPNDLTNSIKFYAVKSTTTSEPPLPADLVSGRSDTDVAIISTGGSNLNITLDGVFYLWGVKFDIGGLLELRSQPVLEECYISWGGAGANKSFGLGTATGNNQDFVSIQNSTINFVNNTGNRINVGRGSYAKIVGGNITGAINPTRAIYDAYGGKLDIENVDLSALTPVNGWVLANSAPQAPLEVTFKNCKIGSTFNLIDGIPVGKHVRVAQYGCKKDTTLTAGKSVQDFEIASLMGTVKNSVKTRTNGASDGISSWSYQLSLNANASESYFLPLESPKIAAWIDGNGTSKTINVYIVREGSTIAPTALNNDEVWVEVYAPSSAPATDESLYKIATSKVATPLTTPSVIPTDTNNTWSGTQANQTAQVISLNISPGYSGPIFVKLFYGKRIATPTTDDDLFVDPKIEIV